MMSFARWQKVSTVREPRTTERKRQSTGINHVAREIEDNNGRTVRQDNFMSEVIICLCISMPLLRSNTFAIRRRCCSFECQQCHVQYHQGLRFGLNNETRMNLLKTSQVDCDHTRKENVDIPMWSLCTILAQLLQLRRCLFRPSWSAVILPRHLTLRCYDVVVAKMSLQFS